MRAIATILTRPVHVCSAPRIPALDAARGTLAVVVVASHVAQRYGVHLIDLPASVAVAAFWIISGYVLALGYDGHIGAFVARRFVRLWPVYAVCWCLGCVADGQWPAPPDLLFSPFALAGGINAMPNPPAWTLFVEVYATPILPLLFAITRTRTAAISVAAMAYGAVLVWPLFIAPACFAFGATAAAFPIPWPRRAPRWLLWLGRISFSLYLLHHPLLVMFGPLIGAALALPAAWLIWRCIECPSLALSRRLRKSGCSKRPRTANA